MTVTSRPAVPSCVGHLSFRVDSLAVRGGNWRASLLSSKLGRRAGRVSAGSTVGGVLAAGGAGRARAGPPLLAGAPHTPQAAAGQVVGGSGRYGAA